MRKSLITGGAGFIGSHLTEALLLRGDEVFIIDDLSTGTYENIRHLSSDPRVHITICSILERQALAPLIEKADIVFHLAATVGVQKIIDSPVETIETNILGSHEVLSLAARFNKLCVVISTSEVYGKSTRVPFRETDDSIFGPTTKSRWSYACSKAIDEFLALAYFREKGLPVIVVRLFNTVGPRQTGRYGMVVPRLVKQALDGLPMTVYGNGQQTRCFMDVTDAVKALLGLAGNPAAVGEIFNIGNPQEISILELAKEIKTITESSSEIILVPYDQAYHQPGFEDMERRVPSIEKIARLTGFAPEIRRDQIIRRVVESLRTGAARGTYVV